MADIATLERALRNADAAGDVEAARTIAQAIKAQSAQPAANPATQPTADNKPSGFAMGVADPIHGGAQLLTKMLPSGVVDAGNRFNNWLAEKTGLVAALPAGGVDQQVREREAAYQAARGPDAGFDWGRLAGNIANPASLSVARLAPAAATLAGRIGIGATAGAASGSLQPVVGGEDFTAEKLKQLGMSAAFGGALPAVAAGVGRMISPAASRNPQLELLRAEGVRPTVGQSLGGVANTIEEKLGSLPIMGDAIRSARRTAVEQFNTAAINRSLEPIGAKVSGTGTDAVRAAGDKISAAYDAAKSQLGAFKFDRTAVSELQNVKQMVAALPAKEQAAFNDVWNKLRGEVSPNGSMVAEGFKRFDSAAGNAASRFKGSPDAYQKQAGDAIAELQRVVTDAAKRANPQASAAMKAADQAWANLVRVESAAGRAVNSGGIFTPAQLGTAVKATDRSVRDRATARGEALMQDLATAGQSVLGNKVPNSGTFDRAALGMGGLGAGFIDPTIPIALTAGAAAYSAPVQRLLSALVSSRTGQAQAVSGLLNQSAPMLAPATGLLGLQLSQ